MHASKCLRIPKHNFRVIVCHKQDLIGIFDVIEHVGVAFDFLQHAFLADVPPFHLVFVINEQNGVLINHFNRVAEIIAIEFPFPEHSDRKIIDCYSGGSFDIKCSVHGVVGHQIWW